jgi:hypothetical protein
MKPLADTDSVLLLHTLQMLEVELHLFATHKTAARLDVLLHEDFREFGQSGLVYSKADILSHFPTETRHAEVIADCFEMKRLSDAIVLLTYRSAHQLVDGSLDKCALRSSLWEHSELRWQMRFHQGTPTARFLTFPVPPHQTVPLKLL